MKVSFLILGLIAQFSLEGKTSTRAYEVKVIKFEQECITKKLSVLTDQEKLEMCNGKPGVKKYKPLNFEVVEDCQKDNCATEEYPNGCTYWPERGPYVQVINFTCELQEKR